MNQKMFYILSAAVAVVLIAISLAWPQGLGTVSPPPFGHALEMPDYFRMVRERDARQAKEASDKAAKAKADAAAKAKADADASAASTAP